MGRQDEDIEIVDPRGRVRAARFDLAPRPRSLEGLIVGFLDNGKPNADVILERLEELVRAQFKTANVVRKPRRRPGDMKWRYRTVGKTDEVIQEMADKCDVVINGVGD